jgi:predicted amidohydrolase YtcJ
LQVQARQQQCNYAPDSRGAKLLYEWIKAGGRYVGNHTSGDGDVDNILLIIDRASRDAGMSYEEIRSKRHAIDHMVLWPRPDQVEPLKRLGVMASGDSFEIIQSTPAAFEIYGEKGISQVVPKRRVIEAEIPTTVEIDRALGSTNLTLFSAGIAPMIERRGWDGKVYGANQALDRQIALKSATYWGAYYLLREDRLGSLEPNKSADFLVLDRDYLTIPEGDIANIRVLMTVVGGKIIHLVPSLAGEIGMRPSGAQVTLGGPASQW